MRPGGSRPSIYRQSEQYRTDTIRASFYHCRDPAFTQDSEPDTVNTSSAPSEREGQNAIHVSHPFERADCGCMLAVQRMDCRKSKSCLFTDCAAVPQV